MKRVLVIGRRGQVATALAAVDWGADIAVTCHGRDKLDLGNPATLRDKVVRIRPDLLINAAAYTAVDEAEREPDAAFALNRDGPAALAEAAAGIGVPLIHLSSDYVFDGLKGSAYVESDAVNPLSVYGASKEAGERALRERLAHHVILRSSWIYAGQGRNFLTTMLRLAREGREIRVVNDQKGSPTAAAEIARAVAMIARRLLAGGGDYGTFHFCGQGVTSWHGFAAAIFALTGMEKVRLAAITTAAFAAPAKRPANSALDCAKVTRVYGIRPAPWRESLTQCVAQMERTSV
jgi:dTDP-4-dehydrorhamnose reductase